MDFDTAELSTTLKYHLADVRRILADVSSDLVIVRLILGNATYNLAGVSSNLIDVRWILANVRCDLVIVRLILVDVTIIWLV